ncbi:hypothetical protein F511_37751 [Dorcoceras hygrometricum]|uniref:Uncharacterized protein n=1 Tax=Dorcoceras hygrometricum TaxID=472368 RepID=A0A2Z7C7E2_9LAMI|nr:hypothetical protein F511_37751 [Dorcoceras hygrometricum]
MRLAPTSFTRKSALQTVGGGRSSIRSTTGNNLPPSICTTRSDGFCHGRNHLEKLIGTSPTTLWTAATRRRYDGGAAAVRWRRGGAVDSMLWRLGTCVTLNGSGIQLAVGPQPLRLRNHNFGLTHRIMVKRLATSPHDPLDSIGYPRMKASGESSTTKHRLLHASGPHRIPPPNDPNGVGKRVKVRRLSCRVSMTFRVVRTNQYNQDLGLIHSTNGNHLESPNEGSSIDHQVTIHLHAHNITMFPTNETWYFTSQMLVSSSGGIILILTAQSTRNEFRIHSDY